jgi:hypothetical protein
MVRREVGGATDTRGHTPERQGLAVNFRIAHLVGRAGSPCARVGARLELTHHQHLAELGQSIGRRQLNIRNRPGISVGSPKLDRRIADFA